MIDDLAPAEVHLVATAREPLGLFTASWQESLKNRNTVPLPDYARTVSKSPQRHLELAHPRPPARAATLGARRAAGAASTCCPCTAVGRARPSGTPSPG